MEAGAGVIVDTHVHFWDPAARRHAWLDDHPGLQRPFLPKHYDADAHRVEGMIFVQADCRDEEALGEARWAAELASRDPRIRGFVAYAPLHLGGRAREALAIIAKQPGVVGVRRLLQDEPWSLVRDPALVEGVRLLDDHGLPFDLCLHDHQLRCASRLVAACPNITFVLDHLGKPHVRAGELDPWRGDLSRLAAHSGVICKLSGLATEAAPDWRASDLRPYLDHALDVFGPYRCMLGSDWPVCSLAITVERWFDVVHESLSVLGPDERQAVLHDNANRVYRSVRSRAAA